MKEKKFITLDGNSAVANVAYMYSDVAAIYPITPSSPMAEASDEMAVAGRKNLFGQKLSIVEMQSEGGASGAVHGSLQAGALTSTFTASQGLLLMIPNMYKIAGELLPGVFHVSARSIAASALSIFGDHSDVMATRSTGFALLAGSSVQQAQDMAAIAHLSAINTRVPFLNFFDGFRTSHEIQKIEALTEEEMRELIEPFMRDIDAFRKRAMNPSNPDTRGTAQNPDIYFQAREGVNKYYIEAPDKVQAIMDLFAKITGRAYKLFDYTGAPDAEKVIVLMGSGADTAEETVKYMTAKGEKVGVITVHLYRPFSAKHFLAVLPKTVKKIAVLDRTKEPGSLGEPLYQDVQTVLDQARKGLVEYNFNTDPMVIGGRYGLSSKEFTPKHVLSLFKYLDQDNPTHSFTVGIEDDVTNLSIPLVDENINILPEGTISALFWGFGSDGTVGANKNTIKIIGENTDNFAQGYFVYDSKKSGGITISHLRFGPKVLKTPYLIQNADYIAVHKDSYLNIYDVLEGIKDNGIFVLNSHYTSSEVWDKLPYDVQKTIIDKKLKFYNINAYKVAKEVGLGNRINVVMQAVFFIVSGVLEKTKAIELIKKFIEKSYGRKGRDIVEKNWKAVDLAESALEQITVPNSPSAPQKAREINMDKVEGFVSEVASVIMKNKGDSLKVSQIPEDGRFQAGVTQYEKRGVANEVPIWEPDKCIQCNICSLVCPHAAIKPKQIEPKSLENKPSSFVTIKSTTKNDRDLEYAIQVSPLDCTGCGVCVEACPAKGKALKMEALEDVRELETEKFDFFEALPNNITDGTSINTVKGSQFIQPLFEYSGACAGCGETPYVKLVTQLVGERMFIANATGCSSIYGGTAPFTPYRKSDRGRGPAWANSLFEDNAEFGFGMALAANQLRDKLFTDIQLAIDTDGISAELKTAFKELLDKKDDSFGSVEPADKVASLLEKEKDIVKGTAKELIDSIYDLKDYLEKKSFWIFGGDGWAYDIGYGGLDHVLAQGLDVNILVMDTEVYSNTGGQASKATPLSATAKFAAAGKRIPKKDLGLMAMSYGYVYVASISLGANYAQAVKAFVEAENFNGPSIIIAYSPCIAHGMDMSKAGLHQKAAVESGYWPIYRFNPALRNEGKNPFSWDSPKVKSDFIKDYIETERRFLALKNVIGEEANKVFKEAQTEVQNRRKLYERMSSLYEVE